VLLHNHRNLTLIAEKAESRVSLSALPQCGERFVHNCFTARPYRCGRSPFRTLTSAAHRGSCGAARYRNGMRRSSSSAGVRKRMMRTSQTRRRRSSIRVLRLRRAAPVVIGTACPHPGVINWRRRRRLTQSRCMSGTRSNANTTLGTSRDGGRAQRGYGIFCMLKVHKWAAAAAEHPADVYPRDAACCSLTRCSHAMQPDAASARSNAADHDYSSRSAARLPLRNCARSRHNHTQLATHAQAPSALCSVFIHAVVA